MIGITAVIALAACGSSGSSKASVSPGAQPAAAKSPANAVVKTSTLTKLGTVLVDANGMTLYTLKHNGVPVACTGACATAWPPLALPTGQSTAVAGGGVTGLGTVVKSNGTHVTEDGAPLYRFQGDRAPGDTNGDGLASFGGVWHVSTVAASAAPAVTTPTTSSSSGGYGY